MEPIIYPYRRTSLETLRIAGGVWLLLLIPVFLCCIAFSLWAPSHSPVTGVRGSEEIEGLLLPSLLSLFMGLIVGPLMLSLNLVPREATLTSEAFSYGYRGRVKTLQLAEIVSVAVTSRPRWRHYYWTVTIEDSRQKRIRLVVQVKTWTTAEVGDSIFDYRVMLRDLLQRLPAAAAVDEPVKNFVATGSFSA